LSDEHFHHPVAKAAFNAMRSLDDDHAPVGIATVLDRMSGNHDAEWWDATFSGAPPAVAEAYYNLETFRRRRVAAAGAQAIAMHASKGHDSLLAETVQHLAREVDAPMVPFDRYPSVWADDLMAEDLPAYDWIIPGLVAGRERFVFVAGEGSGKTTILRQIAVRASLGYHPLSEQRVEPVSVLYVDLENSRYETRREIQRMWDVLRPTVDFRPRLRLSWATGFDMERVLDRSWLIDLADEIEPRLIVFGPLYKAVSGRNGWGKQSEEIASILTEHIDLLAARYEAGVLLEGHAPHKPPGEQRREWRVRGSAAYQGWANFILGFQDVRLDAAIDRERRHTLVGGKKRDAVRQLPACLVRGPDAMPWMPCMIPGAAEEGHDDKDVRKWL
jgi:replicative DNA helicase